MACWSFFEAHNAKVSTVLSSNGREFCVRKEHPYELFFSSKRSSKVRRPQSNGFVERLHQTLLDKNFRLQGRNNW